MVPPDESRPRIIVDEDWKTQVEREKAAASQPPSPTESGSPQGNEPPDRLSQQTHDESVEVAVADDDRELPPASFGLLVSSIATQTLIALGQIPDPVDKRPTVRLRLAQHHIDSLAILEEKTRGNLTGDDGPLLESVLHQLRMAYVHVKSEVERSRSTR